PASVFLLKPNAVHQAHPFRGIGLDALTPVRTAVSAADQSNHSWGARLTRRRTQPWMAFSLSFFEEFFSSIIPLYDMRGDLDHLHVGTGTPTLQNKTAVHQHGSSSWMKPM
ncbi:MAG: hypothetical protein O7F71_21120, partial [Gammaproteobacteria bacterium]|nr:hypothetical protein [Gammaproteobacteria bacterium]